MVRSDYVEVFCPVYLAHLRFGFSYTEDSEGLIGVLHGCESFNGSEACKACLKIAADLIRQKHPGIALGD